MSSHNSTAFIQSIKTLLIVCAKQVIIASKKLRSSKLSKGSPKKLITSISSKTIKLGQRKKRNGVGDDGVWRKQILMGDKCQPLDFSGVIYYDKDGNLLNELPMRSPRASPMPGYAFAPLKSSH
ncbi:hypothetical protein CTI12_AA588490 [Artemisia annua]|uniref:Uncharacterized protein n=1 Tax=Artemisia annua TaxID=35608 RepID=A0A2U1KLM2_ARTAN|nr:hypothetical protein CTI12_AA588490 [Artemisia annua]